MFLTLGDEPQLMRGSKTSTTTYVRKVHPRTGHEGPGWEQRYRSTLSLTSALDWGADDQRHPPRPLYSRERDPAPSIQEGGRIPGQVWTGAENLARTGIRYLDRPARGEWLYRLSYPGQNYICAGQESNP